jgi:hypothetical protein
MPRFDTFHNALIIVPGRPKQNAVTGHDNAAAVSSQCSQHSTNCAFVAPTVVQSLYLAVKSDEAGDTPLQTSFQINRSQQLITLGFHTNNSTPSTDRPFPAETFATFGIFRSNFVAQQFMGEILIPGPRLFVTAKVNTDFVTPPAFSLASASSCHGSSQWSGHVFVVY